MSGYNQGYHLLRIPGMSHQGGMVLVDRMLKSYGSYGHWQLNNTSSSTKICRLLGRVTQSRFCLKSRPNVKLCRVLGKVTFCRFWLNLWPNSNLSKALGNVTPSKLWLNLSPNVNLCSPLGKVTCCRLWLK